MANVITKTTLLDGPRNLIVLVTIDGDASGNETNTLLINRSDYAPTDGTEIVVEKIEGLLSGFSATLSFDATADLPFAMLPDGDWFCYDWERIGGVSSNKAGAGSNGDILLTTAGLDAGATDSATFYLHMRKA
jgi:hypothetical protein